MSIPKTDLPLGRKIYEIRLAQHLTQTQLAKKARLTQGMIAQIENGKRSVSDRTLIVLAQSLGDDFGEDWLTPFVSASSSVVNVEGAIAAGKPIEPITQHLELSIPTSMLRRGREHFALRVTGDSMIDEHICDGDVVIAVRTPTAENGQVVVALVDGNATLKKFYKQKNAIVLQPANPNHPPMVFDKKTNVEVQGVVVGIVRNL
ncbi:MAG: repressor LexA [Acidobacteria bacterium]|nr:repressor LexA [Acidobacteriota bacterium]